jgi:hypothetical protein
MAKRKISAAARKALSSVRRAVKRAREHVPNVKFTDSGKVIIPKIKWFKSKVDDLAHVAKKFGKRKSAGGNIYYENRINRGDFFPKMKL